MNHVWRWLKIQESSVLLLSLLKFFSMTLDRSQILWIWVSYLQSRGFSFFSSKQYSFIKCKYLWSSMFWLCEHFREGTINMCQAYDLNSNRWTRRSVDSLKPTALYTHLLLSTSKIICGIDFYFSLTKTRIPSKEAWPISLSGKL